MIERTPKTKSRLGQRARQRGREPERRPLAKALILCLLRGLSGSEENWIGTPSSGCRGRVGPRVGAFLPYHRKQIKGSGCRRWRYSAAALCVDRLLSDDTKSLFRHCSRVSQLAARSSPALGPGLLRFYGLALWSVGVIKINLDQFGWLPNC